MKAPKAPETFGDLRDLLARLPGPDEAARASAEAREPRLTKPPGALGRLETIAHWLAAWQGRHPPAVNAPRVLVFAGNHGAAAEGVSAYPPEVTAQMVGNFQAGGAAVNQIARAAGAEFSVIPLEMDRPTQSFTQGPAMTEAETMTAFAAGWRAAGEADCDLLAVGEMGIANTASAAAIACAVFGGEAADWTGPGTGVAGAALARKTDVVARAVQLHGAEIKDGLDALARLGGRETAAMAGAVTYARTARIPVVLDGYVAGAAAAALETTASGAPGADGASGASGACAHCIAGHLSAEPAHARMLAALGMEPLLDLNMRLGEASGAALAIPIIRAAAACHAGMATFEDAGVADKT